MHQVMCALLLIALSLGWPAFAAEATAPVEREVAATGSAETMAQLDEVVVSGEQPGPGLWRIESGENTLYILGTHGPLPKRMRWKSDEVEALIAEADVVIEPPTVSAKSGLGMFRTMLLLPAALKVRGNPDEQRLVDVVPADLYQRWVPLRDKYLRNQRSVEKRRPIFAAAELYQKAIKKTGLEESSRIQSVLQKAAKRHKIEVVQPNVLITIDDPKQLLKELSGTQLDDIECFRRTLERLEVELGVMRARANAWAIGDIEAMRALPDHNQARTCINAVTGSSALQSRGFDGIRGRVMDTWVAAAAEALAEHSISFGWLPMRELLADGGYLDVLRAQGYEVIDPE